MLSGLTRGVGHQAFGDLILATRRDVGPVKPFHVVSGARDDVHVGLVSDP